MALFNEVVSYSRKTKWNRMETWLALTDYSSKYKISVSTLRRRIKADDIKHHFQDGKYFIFDEPVKSSMKSGPSLNSNLEPELIFEEEFLNGTERPLPTNQELPARFELAPPIYADRPYENRQQQVPQAQAYNPDFLENLKRSANSKLPQVKMQQGALSQQSIRTAKAVNIDEEYYFKKEKEELAPMTYLTAEAEPSNLKEFSDKISKIGSNEPVLTAANKLLNELKKAYTQILYEKEEQMMILKEEVSDLKTLVKALERENEKLKQQW